MIETVKDALLADLRARYGELVGDPTLDITLIVPPTFNRETRAPQIILTDFSTPRTFISAVGQTYMNEDRAGGTIDELNDPPRHDLHFAVTAAARSSRAAERMAEALAIYFDQHPPTLDVAFDVGGVEQPFRFPKRMVSEFRDATVPNGGGLFWQEGRAAIMAVPIYDGQITQRNLAKTVTIGVEEQESGAELVSATVEATE
ncbi:MAG TPA: hypothetical protein PLI86_00045 [bacterium]|nr:hypothetical protein [bacterium]